MTKMEEKILNYAYKLMTNHQEKYDAGLKNDMEGANEAYFDLLDHYSEKDNKRKRAYEQFLEKEVK